MHPFYLDIGSGKTSKAKEALINIPTIGIATAVGG